TFATASSPAATGIDFGDVQDIVPPSITAATPNAPNPTNAATATFAVTFNEAVTGLSVSNFALVTGGVSGASITGVSGSGTSYTVTVNTGSNSGTIVLRLANSTGLTDLALNPVQNVPFDSSTLNVD